MTFFEFYIQMKLNASQIRAFRSWLGVKRNVMLPEKEWMKLWEEFNGQ